MMNLEIIWTSKFTSLFPQKDCCPASHRKIIRIYMLLHEGQVAVQLLSVDFVL